MAGHLRAVDTIIDTIKETTNIGSIWRKMYIKRSIGITTLIVKTDQLVKLLIIGPPADRYENFKMTVREKQHRNQ